MFRNIGEDSLEDMVRLLHKQLKSSAVNNSDNDTSTKQQLTIDLTNSSELGKAILIHVEGSNMIFHSLILAITRRPMILKLGLKHQGALQILYKS